MNLRLNSKGARVRISREELSALERGEALAEIVPLPGGEHFSWCLSAEGAARPAGAWSFQLALSAAELETLASAQNLALAEVAIEIDAFTSERRARKEKSNEPVLATDGSR